MAALILILGLLAQTAVTSAEAERLARSGQTEQALEAFEALVAQVPEDVDSRVWVGRLQVRLGRVADAERTFRAVIAADPGHVDARVGLAAALLNANRVEDALDEIVATERLAPASSDVYGVKARVLRRAGRTTDAHVTFERAVAQAPGDPDLQTGLEQTRRQIAHRVDASLARELYDGGLPPGSILDAAIDLFVDDAHRVSGRLQVQDRFGGTEVRAGAGLDFRVGRTVQARAAMLFSPGADLVARADLSGDLEWSRRRVQPAVTVRYLDFSGARVVVIGPSATWEISDAVALVARYYRSQTRFVPSSRTVGDNSAMVGLRWRARPRVWLSGAYARGIESFETASVDRFGRLRAETVAAGVRLDLRSGTSLSMSPEHQWRSGNRRLVRVTFTATQHF